jgi:hypothetical protein
MKALYTPMGYAMSVCKGFEDAIDPLQVVISGELRIAPTSTDQGRCESDEK